MIIDGRAISAALNETIKETIKAAGITPHLAMVLVGDDPASRSFLQIKERAAARVGIKTTLHTLESDLGSNGLRDRIRHIASKETVHGVIVELPLPDGIKTQYVLNAVPINKDADVLSQAGQGAFFVSRNPILPPAVEAVRQVLSHHSVEVRGKQCVVFGYGALVGRPVAHWLLESGATVTVINEHSYQPANFSRHADIIVSGVGAEGVVTGDMVKPGATVIDFGYSASSQGIKGDVVFEDVINTAGLVTPVPGGVGPVVVSAVLLNTVKLAIAQNK